MTPPHVQSQHHIGRARMAGPGSSLQNRQTGDNWAGRPLTEIDESNHTPSCMSGTAIFLLCIQPSSQTSRLDKRASSRERKGTPHPPLEACQGTQVAPAPLPYLCHCLHVRPTQTTGVSKPKNYLRKKVVLFPVKMRSQTSSFMRAPCPSVLFSSPCGTQEPMRRHEAIHEELFPLKCTTQNSPSISAKNSSVPRHTQRSTRHAHQRPGKTP